MYIFNPANLTHFGSQSQKAEKHRQVSFYARVTFLKKSQKLNSKFPFKTVYLLRISKLTSSGIAYYYTIC